MTAEARIHPTADVSPAARIGSGTAVWHHCQVREGAQIGRNCILSKGVYVDTGVVLGDNVKVQNCVSIYHGVTLEDGVFCGPHCVFTNDKQPRAINPDGSLKAPDDWTLSETRVKTGASIGANAVIVCGLTIGAWAMIGAGSVVTRDVPAHGLVFGNPAQLRGFVCACGERLQERAEGQRSGGAGEQGGRGAEERGEAQGDATVALTCRACGAGIEVSTKEWERIS
ncbi:MAG: acyltransferase [Anaerolineae bacterium]|jgi:acetyltransferase-like isoleucine patch superfamily enzyme